MFIREKETKTTTILQLVRSRRNADGKVRQEIVLSLGDAHVMESGFNSPSLFFLLSDCENCGNRKFAWFGAS